MGLSKRELKGSGAVNEAPHHSKQNKMNQILPTAASAGELSSVRKQQLQVEDDLRQRLIEELERARITEEILRAINSGQDFIHVYDYMYKNTLEWLKQNGYSIKEKNFHWSGKKYWIISWAKTNTN